jgi:hypothetical protein
MALHHSPRIVTDGLVLALDAGDRNSYVSGSVVWNDLSSQRIVGTIVSGSFDMLKGSSIGFNGSSSFCNITSSHSHLSSSALEVVFTPKSTSSINKKMIFGYAHRFNFSFPTFGTIYIESNNQIGASLITATQIWRQVFDTSTISIDSTYHVVFNKNVETGNMELYVNAKLKNSNTFDSASYAQWPTPGSYIYGTDNLNIGASNNALDSQGWGSGSFFSGSIHFARIYNRVLSSQEILQNYNATKGRFGL